MRCVFFRKLFFLTGVSLLFSMIQAQETISVSGGNSSGNGGSVSYTVGQVSYITQSSSTGSVTPGVQQPYEISVVSSTDDPMKENIWCVYPNPTTGNLIIMIDNENPDGFNFQLYNSNGQVLISDKILGKQTNLNLENYPSAIYLLKVYQSNIEIITFKIIKN
jgi:hypothetical protein